MRLLWVLFSLSACILWAGDKVHTFEGPREFQEAEVESDVEATWRSSHGVQKQNSFEIEWSPEKIILRGKPEKIQSEAVIIRESLRAFPFLAQFENLVVPSADSKTLDLTKLLLAIQKKLPENCYNCFSLPLCAMKKKSKMMDFQDLLAVLPETHLTKKAKDLSPGSVVIYRENYNDKQPMHAYIWLSPNLALEKHGTATVLIRTHSSIEKEYTWLAKNERKYFRWIDGKKLPTFTPALKQENWVKKK